MWYNINKLKLYRLLIILGGSLCILQKNLL